MKGVGVARHVQPPARKPSFGLRLLGVIGELLITIGLVLALFIVWQVWWTDIGAHKEQRELVANFRAETDTAPPSEEGKRGEGPPPTLDGDAIKASLNTNEPWGVMHIPRFGSDYEVAIAEGVDLASVLDKGSLGHYPDSALPGELGNMAIAGHRQTYGAPLKQQPDLEEGDPLIIETKDYWYVYRVTSHDVVSPSYTAAVAAVPGDPTATPDKYLLTLTTCHPPFVSNQRWVTYAEFDYWMPTDSGTPKELL